MVVDGLAALNATESSTMRISLPLFAMIAINLYAAGVPGRGSFERTLNVAGPVDLDVLSEIGGVIVTAGPSNIVRVHAVLSPQLGPLDLAQATGRIRELEMNPPIEQTGNRIRIGYPADPNLLTRISMRLEVQVPRATVVRARTSSGGIEVSGLDGAIHGESRSGRIVIADITGDVTAKAQSGGIVVSRCRGRVEVHNGSGGAEVNDAVGAVEATAGSGAIRISQTEPAPIRARARSGAIKVKLAPATGYNYLARSENGKMSVAEVGSMKESNRGELTGKLRDGGPLVDVSTHSSRISIEQ
jgi:hypothetical protein